jgi:acyl carrier protein
MISVEDPRTCVLTVLADILQIKSGEIPTTASLEQDLKLDSTEIVDAQVRLEKRLGISMKGVKMVEIGTVNDLIAIAAARMKDAGV